MKRIIHFCIPIIFFCAISLNAYGQKKEDIDHLSRLLDEQKYTRLANEVSRMRQKAYYKNVFMDYCLAYSYCKLNMPSDSRIWFDHIIKNYNSLDAEKENQLIQLRNECTANPQTTSGVSSLKEFITALNNDGFEGNSAGIESKLGIPSLTDRVVEIDYEQATFDVVNRQFAQSQKDNAWEYFRGILGSESNNYRRDSTKHLLIIYSKQAGDIKKQMIQLENYYQYYNKVYGLGDDNRLITVFYFNSRNELTSSSQKLHNIKVPNSIFGYASSADLILTGIASRLWLGALKHELFHLMIRSYIGDTPPWMDEGIACLFESSNLKAEDDISFNTDNYRTTLLRRFNIIRQESEEIDDLPTINQIVNFNWRDFSGHPGDLMIKASINYSISYLFSKYLLEKGKLKTILDAYQNRTYTLESSTNNTPGESLIIMKLRTTEQLFDETLGMNMSDIQTDFEKWCMSSLRFNPYEY